MELQISIVLVEDDIETVALRLDETLPTDAGFFTAEAYDKLYADVVRRLSEGCGRFLKGVAVERLLAEKVVRLQEADDALWQDGLLAKEVEGFPTGTPVRWQLVDGRVGLVRVEVGSGREHHDVDATYVFGPVAVAA